MRHQEARGVHIENLAAWVTTVASNHSRTRFRSRSRERRGALQRMAPRLDPPADPGSRGGGRARGATCDRRALQADATTTGGGPGGTSLGLAVGEVAREPRHLRRDRQGTALPGRHRLAAALGEPDAASELRPTDPTTRPWHDSAR